MEFGAALRKRKIDFALFCSLGSERPDKNMLYFSGYDGIGCLVFPAYGEPFLLVPAMEFERAKRLSSVKTYRMGKGKIFTLLGSSVKKMGIAARRIGVDESDFPLKAARSLQKSFRKAGIADIGNSALSTRSIKSPKEVSIISRACDIASGILSGCIERFERFGTEKEVSDYLITEAARKGVMPSFPPIVASGKNACMPHHSPTGQPLQKGFCIIDFGVVHDGYCSDISRTIYLGKPSSSERNLYANFVDVQEQLINSLTPGKDCSEMHRLAQRLLGRNSKYFIHGLGHGIGLQIHELPTLSTGSPDRIREGMVFTIEPGIYLPQKSGIRIEDDVAVMNGKIHILTRMPKKLIVKEGFA